jgi:CheY-like chemotaxis protein
LQLPPDDGASTDGTKDFAMLDGCIPTSPPVAATIAASDDGPRLRILLAEDNPTNQLIARRMLESMGHRVHLACNGQEAVEAVRAHQFDAVLMDVMMPEMDGMTASRMIRAEEVDRRVPILAVTANAFEHDRHACLEAGMDGFLGKPFSRSNLRAVLAKITGAAAATPPAFEAASSSRRALEVVLSERKVGAA